ncbi:MAG: tRNA 2-thiouridine(34) synthase MnmA [Verrucomicrobia bacterium]|nr:tRNA 2-thiouridine(34) synthase MnmA [Verrucomicrobiota bacterium]MBV9299357.1 tRNA 2-thiouridine(34) synthase MnmA [Verrucomicrobiota bacterium]
MSGGVDSSVAALLLQRKGLPIEGAYMKNWINEENIVGNCPWQQDIKDARAVAEALQIPFRIVNLMQEYRARVVEYLLKGYQVGITPNPDAMCNREMKFGVFLELARTAGFHAVATGHYARRLRQADGSWEIFEGVDKSKDQSYFLALLQQHQIAAARFPVGELRKAEVRELANAFGLVTASKKDSQGICFIGEIKMRDFLQAFVPDNPGPIRNRQGKRLGEHKGLHLYTLGQRRGVGVPSNTPNEAYVVVEKRIESNELIVAFDHPDTEGLYARRCRLGSLSFTNKMLPTVVKIAAKPRYRARAAPILFEALDKTSAILEFDQPQRALTPGQVCALYDGERLLGGGIFEQIF